MATKLTEHFTLEELIYSNTGEKKKIDNTPSLEITERLKELAVNILEPLRVAWGSGIEINSGYRCEKLNKAIGGSATSAHVIGYAADIAPSNGKMAEFKAFVIKWLRNNNIKFDQYINEFSGVSQWVHVSLYNRAGQQRKQYLRYKGGVYSKI